VTVKVSRKSATPETADFKSNSGLAMLRKIAAKLKTRSQASGRDKE
jgi:hypothetical protein